MNSSLLKSILALTLVLELSGCGNPPPPPKSAKAEIEGATNAMDTAKTLAAGGHFERAKGEYDRAIEEIVKGESFARGTELTLLGNLKKEAREKRTAMETKAMQVAVAPKKDKGPAAPATEDPEAEKKRVDAVKAKELEAQKAAAAAALETTKPAAKPKVDEPDEEIAAKEKKKDPANPGKNDELIDPAKPRKDKSGIFNEVTDKSPPLEIAKLERVGKFSVAYCQLHNNTDDGRRITIVGYFKNRDNQDAIPPRTTVAFPFERFSIKVKDLIADQSVRNLAANAEEVPGHQFLQFVVVGESNTEDLAKLIAKVYVNVLYDNGKQVDAASNATAVSEAVDLVKGLVPKTPAKK